MIKVSSAVAWLARETAASDTSPSEPTMMLSSMLTLSEISDWKAAGTATISSDR